jgi:cytochrome c-type biogenesis protein CcmE
VKKGYWIAAVLALAFVGLGVTAFQKTLTPYLTFDEARKSRGVVQVMGALDKTSDRYDTASQELSFSLLDDKGRSMQVVYKGIRPGNFKDAISIVAIGRYQKGRIEAEKLLVKCPSKYQGAEVEKSYTSAAPSGSGEAPGPPSAPRS